MPKFTVETQSNQQPNDAFNKIKSMLSNDADLKKMDSSYTCNFNDSQMTGTAKGSKFSAALSVQASGGGSKVKIDVDLPLMLTPVKGIVQSTLQKKLEKALA